MAEIGILSPLLAIAGAGFRLSLVLNAVGVEMATSDLDIQAIARAVSLYSLMLKQVAKNLESARDLLRSSAWDTARGIANQSQLVFDEIKDLTAVDQKKDERGHIRAIAVGKRASLLRRARAMYLVGQLEGLKLSLALLGQVVEYGKLIVENQNNNPSKSQITEERVLQEKAEIQNLVVVRHWALVDLRRRYEAAEHENEERKTPHQMNWSPPGTNGYAHVQHDPRLQIEGPKNEEDMSKALVKYEETPLRQLEDSLSKAMHRPNKLLRAPGEDIVDHLLNAWTRLRDSPSRPQTKNQKHHARCDSDSEDNEINFTRSDYGGRHIDGPRYRKNVHFQPAHVESDTESDRPQRRRRGLKHYVLDSDSVSTDSDSEPPTPTSSRRSSESRQYENGDRTRRPYVTSSDRSPNSSRPSSRNGSPPPIPMPRPNPAGWTRPPGGPPGTPTSLRPPPPHNVPPLPVPQRRLSTGPYAPMSPQLSNYPIPVSPSTSPSNTRGIVYPIPQQGLPSPHPLNMYRPASTGSHVRGSVRGRDSKRVSGDRQSFRESAKRDVKRGIIGAGAVAGLMDILEGLGGI